MKRSEFDTLNTWVLPDKDVIGHKYTVLNYTDGIPGCIKQKLNDATYHAFIVNIDEEDVSLVKENGIERVVYKSYIMIPSYLLYYEDRLSSLELSVLTTAAILDEYDSCGAERIALTINTMIENGYDHNTDLVNILSKADRLREKYKYMNP